MKLEFGHDLAVVIDPQTGEPSQFWSKLDGNWTKVSLSCSVSLLVGGDEERGPTGGLKYPNALEISGSLLLSSLKSGEGVAERWEVLTRLGEWTVNWIWTMVSANGPIQLEISVGADAENESALRQLKVASSIELPSKELWTIEVPGNQLRSNIPLNDLPHRVGISPATGSRGSSAIVSLHRNDQLNLLVWPFSPTEPSEITLAPNDAGVDLIQRIGLAGFPTKQEPLTSKALILDMKNRDWEQTKISVSELFPTLGITSPGEKPDWITGALILEAQIGFSPFWGGHKYQPYESLSDLRKDLPRLTALGFDCIQLMPRQPYPSYNIHDLFDIESTYAPENELRDFVEECHTRNVRVILDILMHGVIDQSAVRQAADGVRCGPLIGELNNNPGDIWASDPNDWTPFQVSWSRHLLDFEPYWLEGSPSRAPLLDEHPDWFFRNSLGEVTGVYTHALDLRHPGFANYFLEATLNLVRRLNIDGFRFDAPTYNSFPNWSKDTRSHASRSVLACNDLFANLRESLKDINEQLLLYTEPSGVVLRKYMDVNYNYDEAWLPSAILNPNPERKLWTVVTAHDLVLWLRDRDSLLPRGSITAHHLDSHDTFWWPEWGKKWRREQYGLLPTIALTSAFLLSGGPFMIFIGGEQGLENELSKVKTLREAFPVLVSGKTEFKLLSNDSSSIFSAIRSDANEEVVILVNLSNDELVTRINFPSFSKEWVGVTEDSLQQEGYVSFSPWSTRVFRKSN